MWVGRTLNMRVINAWCSNSFSGNVNVFFFCIVSGSGIWTIPLSNKQVLDIPLVILLRLNCTIIIIMMEKIQWLKTAKVDLLLLYTWVYSYLILESDWRQRPHLEPTGLRNKGKEREIKEIWELLHSAQELQILLLLNFIGQSMSIWISSCQGVGKV